MNICNDLKEKKIREVKSFIYYKWEGDLIFIVVFGVRIC